MADLLTTMRQSAAEAGRDPESIEVTAVQLPITEALGAAAALEQVRAMADIGVTRLRVTFADHRDSDGLRVAIERFADQVIARSPAG
jgi:Cu/Ag efflux pump CusA